MHQCDVAVIGGSLCGCMAAIEAAREGAGVLLLEAGTFLGNEFTQSLRPWINSSGYENIDKDLKRALFGDTSFNNNYGADYEIPLYMGEVKKNLLKMLLENGVVVLFMSEAVGIVTADDEVKGVLIGTKNGLKVIKANAIIDATENKRAAWFGGSVRKVRQGEVIVRRTVEYHNVEEPAEMYISVPENLGIYDNVIELHHGKHLKNQYFAEFALKFGISDGSFKEKTSMENEARRKTVLLAEYLKKDVKEFKNAFLQQSSYQLHCPQIFSIENSSNEEDGLIEIKTCKNLYTFSAAVSLSVYMDCIEANQYVNYSKTAGKKAASLRNSLSGALIHNKFMLCLGYNKFEFDVSKLKEDKDERAGVSIFSANLPLGEIIPETDNFDIVVCGGGTSGVPAAIASANMGAKVLLIENFWGLGGTKTLGGVAHYYHGFRGGFTGVLDEIVLSVSKRVTARAESGHIESKMLAMADLIYNKGISLFMGTKIVGTIMKDSRIIGIVTANSDGLGIINCKLAVDATGDGDVAAFAGAEYSYGSPRDESVQTFNHNGFVKGSFTDLGVVDTRKLSDVMRGLYIGHEMADKYDFRPLLTIRESRRVKGDYEINISDIMFKTRFSDVISIAQTDCDPHGINVSLISRLGYLPLRNGDKFTCIPYRACLPKGIDGLLIAAKAISATKDAAGFIRMSADIQNLGYAVGTAAALSCRHGVMPRNINIRELQETLLKEGILQESLLKAEPNKPISNEALIEALANGDEEAFLKVICREKEAVFHPLMKKYEESSEKLSLAKALAWFGSNKGVDYLLQELDRLWLKEDNRFHMDLHPEKGDGTLSSGFIGEPSVYWEINQLIVLLSLAGDKSALGRIREIADATEAGGQQYIVPQAYMYGKVRIDWMRIPHYDRILSLTFALERLADAGAVPALERLVEKPYIGGYAARHDIYAGGMYMSAYLEICIARALARCGSKKGALLLADYMDDVQAVLSNHAYSELKEISGLDLGKDSDKWRGWITEQKVIPVKPYTEVFHESMQ